VVTTVAPAGPLTWQFMNMPELLRSCGAQRAAAETQQVVEQSDLVDLVEVNARFTRADIPGQNTLL
jgi:hypothetical protein